MLKMKRKKVLLFILKTIFLIIPFVWIFSRLNGTEFVSAFGRIEWWTIPALFTSVFIAMVLQGVRWWLLLYAFNPDLSFSKTLSYHFKSLYYSIILPNATAQEVVRTVFITKDVKYCSAST